MAISEKMNINTEAFFAQDSPSCAKRLRRAQVMSVAAMQQQLAASTLGDVELQPYFFTDLCRSIADA